MNCIPSDPDSVQSDGVNLLLCHMLICVPEAGGLKKKKPGSHLNRQIQQNMGVKYTEFHPAEFTHTVMKNV